MLRMEWRTGRPTVAYTKSVDHLLRTALFLVHGRGKRGKAQCLPATIAERVGNQQGGNRGENALGHAHPFPEFQVLGFPGLADPELQADKSMQRSLLRLTRQTILPTGCRKVSRAQPDDRTRSGESGQENGGRDSWQNNPLSW